MIQGYVCSATLVIEPLEVYPIMGILQEATFIVINHIFPLSMTSMDDIRAIPHGLKLPFSILIKGFIVNEYMVPLTKGAWVNMGVIMALQLSLSCFNYLESSMKILIGSFKNK